MFCEQLHFQIYEKCDSSKLTKRLLTLSLMLGLIRIFNLMLSAASLLTEIVFQIAESAE